MRNKKRYPDSVREGFARRLSALMGDMSLVELADKLEGVVSSKSLWTYRRGLELPSPYALMAIADLFSVTVDWLLKGTDSKTLAIDEDFLRLFKEYERFVSSRPELSDLLREALWNSMQNFIALASKIEVANNDQ